MLFSLTLLSRRIPENGGGPMLYDGLFASRTRHLHCLLLAAIVTQPLLTASLLAESHARPNILFVMTDDQGYWDTGATGNPHIDTPNIDRIAADGVQLDRYYAAMVCAPTRAGFMTGRHYLRTKLYNTRFGGDSLGLEEVTIAQRLQQAGYRTGLFGKWHLGKYPGYQPQERGFDAFFGHYHGHLERYQFPDQIYHNGRAVEARGYVTDLFSDAAIDFIEHTVHHAEQPFFCAVTYNAPHSPFLLDTSHYGQADGDRLISKYLERGLPIREARIYGLIERVDQNVGRLLEKLEELEIARDTLVIFTSDNGGVSKFFKGGMRGNKASAYEGGVRAPCFVRWTETVPAGKKIDVQTSHIDWFPTFCELAGVDVPQDRIIDGKSLVKLLQSGTAAEHHTYVYHTWDRYFPRNDRRWSISDARWKLLCQVGAQVEAKRSHWQLFDLQHDPGEKTNIAAKHPEIVDRLRAEFVRWFAEVTDGIEYAPAPIPVGYPDHSEIAISPSWAKWFGEQTRYVFDGYDWDTIEGWQQPDDGATWRLNVLDPGAYTLMLRYGCRPLDAGGKVSITIQQETNDNADPLSAVIHHIQATATADQFDTFEVGSLTLPAGACKLTVKIVACPGKEAMRLNQILLRKQE